ncbi:sigma-70 family RNA polymerase sigma factor [Pendulispora rubella]|uniref:Sigma-70 family RNA polymerase sigma factor n=1 Tax=Pendulispora rubella TaxID=2741070 RepID=A0ABZ2L6N6_9BACT
MTKAVCILQDQGMEVAHARDDAFRRLFAAEFRYVWTSLRRLGVDSADLDDVVHEVFLAVHRRFDTYDPARPIRPWLFAFAFRFASDYRKQARIRFRSSFDGDESADPRPAADELLERAEDQRLAAIGLEGIALDRRAVFILYEIDEVPMNEIAASLGVPLHTAYSRLRVAREEFAAAVQSAERSRGARRGGR